METKSPLMQAALDLAQTYATRSKASILILGETGTGKTHLASLIHTWTGRQGPFVVFDCAAANSSLIESELFGHAKGAFTGADRAHKGAFERADGGTIFLDEIGELPLELQPRLLRAVQDCVIRPVGGAEEKRVDVRIVAATNRDLQQAVADGSFRADLRYRLAQLDVTLPPLRDRIEDIPEFLKSYAFQKNVLDVLQAHHWPGNIRELMTFAEKISITNPNPDTTRALLSRENPPDNSRETVALKLAARTQGVRVRELQNVLAVGRVTAWRLLTTLADQGHLARARDGRCSLYISRTVHEQHLEQIPQTPPSA